MISLVFPHARCASAVGVPLSATRAQRELSNFLFFGKPMRVTFAKAKSDVLAKLDGSFQQRAKRKGPEDNRPKKGSAGQPAAKKQKVKAAEAAPAAAVAAPVQPAAAMVVSNEPPPPPHRILFVENLPPQGQLTRSCSCVKPNSAMSESDVCDSCSDFVSLLCRSFHLV
jgi:hypothetical protein